MYLFHTISIWPELNPLNLNRDHHQINPLAISMLSTLAMQNNLSIELNDNNF